jgi:hypothetical protein
MLWGVVSNSHSEVLSRFTKKEPLSYLLTPRRSEIKMAPHFAIGLYALGTGHMETIGIPFLGHSLAIDSTKSWAIVFPQRPEAGLDVQGIHKPGTMACAIDLERRRIIKTFHSPPNRHFFGHGIISQDGRTLYSTVNNLATGQGIIEIRDTGSYTIIGEIPTYGAGPHEMATLQNGTVAVVCNYGADPHRYPNPDASVLDPSLSYIELSSGKLLRQDRLPSNLYSIRHLALTQKDDVALALHHESPPGPGHPCVAVRLAGAPLQLTNAPSNVVNHLASTALSVALDPAALVAGTTHPEGNRVTFWRLADGSLLNSFQVASPQGIVYDPPRKQFIVSAHQNQFFRVSHPHLSMEQLPSVGPAGINWRHTVLA